MAAACGTYQRSQRAAAEGLAPFGSQSKGCGYVVDHRLINSRALTPQNRKRLYIVGLRTAEGAPPPVFEWPWLPDLGLRLGHVLEERPGAEPGEGGGEGVGEGEGVGDGVGGGGGGGGGDDIGGGGAGWGEVGWGLDSSLEDSIDPTTVAKCDCVHNIMGCALCASVWIRAF